MCLGTETIFTIPEHGLLDRSGKYLRQAFPALLRWTLAGGAAALILGGIEWIDVTARLSSSLGSPAQKLEFASYYSIYFLTGLLIGMAVGLGVISAACVRAAMRLLLERAHIGVRFARDVSLWITFGLAAIVAKQYGPIRRFALGQIREAEKIHLLNQPLLNHERATTYLVLASLAVGGWFLWKVTMWSASMKPFARASFLIALWCLILAGYAANSRVEPELYEHSLHETLFLVNTLIAMSFAASLYFLLSARSKRWPSLKNTRTLATAALAGGALITASAIFTFVHINRDHTVEEILFYRTVEARTGFELAHWMLDRDRDGYSALLGGGDKNDSRADINPGVMEVAGNGIDNNCIGGDLTPREITAWRRAFITARRPPDPNAKRLNIVYIFVDALRADHLGVYGYRRDTSPNIDRLAARSVVFANAYTPAPNTFEAMPKFMKSSYWDAHVPTWTEVLADNGYDTMLFPRRAETLLRHVKGMKEIYRPQGAAENSIEYTVDNAISVLSNRTSTEPFCAYLYSLNPHRPYHKYSDFDFGSSTADLYDGEIAHLDHHLGRLFNWLEKSGRMKDTMIVLMADHGESLGERLIYKHSTELYNDQTHIPMIVYMPDVGPGKVASYVTSVDLGSTILSAVGLKCPHWYAGINLVPAMRGQSIDYPPVYGEQTTREDSPFVMPSQQIYPPRKKYMLITQDGFKLIYDRDFYCFELYDLKHDPGELHNLYDALHERAAAMTQMIGRYIDVVEVSRPADADERQYIFTQTRRGGPDELDNRASLNRQRPLSSLSASVR